MKKEKLINKIKNLLDLASDKNSSHEAEAASRKAQALIMKYNVEESELRGGTEATIEDILYPAYKIYKYQEGKWMRSLFGSVARFNFCKIIISQKWVESEGKTKEHYYILGEASNVELVKFLSEQIVYRLRSIEDQEWKKYSGSDSRGVFKRGFLKGAAWGIHSKLEAQWNQFSEDDKTNAIIVTNRDKIEKYVEQKWGNLGKARSGSTSSRSGYDAGVKAGKSMNINAGIRGKNGSKLLN